MPASAIRVVLVDDHELILNGLAAAFSADARMEVVGRAATVDSALQVAAQVTPDVVVTDLQLPDGTGLDIVRSLRRQHPEMGLVILTMHSGDAQIFAALDAGASAFVGKDAPAADVLGAAHHAAVSPRTFVCAGLLDAMMRRRDGVQIQLSTREREVLDLLAQGLGVSQISGQLYLSDSTTKSHIARIYAKLGAANRAQALVTAMRMGLLTSVFPSAIPSAERASGHDDR